MEQYFKLLNVTKHSSIDEIKHSYKIMAKKCHPDLVGGDGSAFRNLNTAFQWLADNHKSYWVPPPRHPKHIPKPLPTHDHIYRILSTDKEQRVMMPFKTAEYDTVLHVMYRDEEYNLLLSKGETLPKTFYSERLSLKIIVEFDDFFGYS